MYSFIANILYRRNYEIAKERIKEDFFSVPKSLLANVQSNIGGGKSSRCDHLSYPAKM